MAEKNSLPRFLETKPPGEDLFDSQSQKKTAESIARLIKENTHGQKLLGLEGVYGAGKSNVIRIIENELASTHRVFVYEAWSHQEDLQRRSFLEELTENLLEKGLVKSKAWKKDLESLLAKKKTTTTRTLPRLSPSILVAILLIISPPLMQALTATASDPWKKLLIASIPYLAAVISWGIAICIDKKYRNPANLFYLYKEQELEKSVSEVISEKEPSVREFRKWMEKLSLDLKKNLIIVVDDMDRLPPDKARICWSLIHTFFSEHQIEGITVIVPFDRSQIQEIFDKGDGSEKAGHFIEKTIPVLFAVPTPVILDWKGFFRAKFTEAFGSTEDADFNIVKNVFDLYEDHITPRKIIAFINGMVAIKLTWKDQIPLRYVALFMMNKEKIVKDPFKEILDKGYLAKAEFLFKTDEDLADHMAALTYNIPVKVARQVTISRELLIAIRNTDLSRLREMALFSNFGEIVSGVYTKETIDIVPAVKSLLGMEAELNKENDKIILADIWNGLAERQIGSAIDEQGLAETHKILLEKANPDRQRKLVQHLLAQFRVSRNFKGDTYFKALDDLDLFLKQKGIQIELPKLVKEVFLSPQDFVDYVNAAKDKYSYFNVCCNNAALDFSLSDRIKDWTPGAEILPYIIDKYNFPETKGRVEMIIQAETLRENNVDYLFTAYKVVSKETGKLSVTLSDNMIAELYLSADAGSPAYFELIAMRLARGADFALPGGSVQFVLPIVVGEEAVDQIAARIEYYLSLEEILKRCVSSPTPLMVAVGKKLIVDGNKGWKLDLAGILPIFDQIVDALGISDQQLFTALDRWSGTLKDTLNAGNIQDILPGFRIYQIALETKNGLSEAILETAQQFAGEQDKTEYTEWFAVESSYGFQLLSRLLKGKIMSQLPNKALEAYKETLNTIAHAPTDQPTPEPGTWEIFYLSADHKQIEGTIKNIRDAFLAELPITPGKFMFFEELLRTQGALGERPGDTTRKLLTPVANEESCLERITDQQSFYGNILFHAGNVLFDFIKEVRKCLERFSESEKLNTFSRGLNDLLTGTVVVRMARYFANGQSEDVTDVVRRRVEDDRNLHFKVGNDLAGKDPAPGMVKKLELEYEYDGKAIHSTVNEHQWLNVPFD
jgi:hypothetical protein